MTENERQVLGDGLDDLLLIIDNTLIDCEGWEHGRGDHEMWLRDAMDVLTLTIKDLQDKLGVSPA